MAYRFRGVKSRSSEASRVKTGQCLVDTQVRNVAAFDVVGKYVDEMA
jgi:hypothetical protein